jgi:Outer membrane lipoprotein carrier protein LolA-like
MISGTAMTIPRLSFFFLVAMLAVPVRGAEPVWGLAEGTFVEKKYLKLLNAPLESSGQLIYTAPHRLEKLTLAPKPESMVVDQGTLTIEMRGRKRSLQIQDYPVLWAFVESIRGTLKGDLSALQQFYKVKLDGTRQTWQLQLQPTEKKMAALIQTIVISGSNDRLNTIEIAEADGDRSVMTVTADNAASAARRSLDFAKNRVAVGGPAT